MKIRVTSVNATCSLCFNRITLILYLHAFSNDLTYRLECTLETCLKMEIHVIALCSYVYDSHEIGIIL